MSDNFLPFVGLAELRRHLPGYMQLLVKQRPMAVPLEDAFLTVSFLTQPPTILARTGDDLPNILNPKHKNAHITFREFQRTRVDRGNGVPAAFEALIFSGGG